MFASEGYIVEALEFLEEGRKFETLIKDPWKGGDLPKAGVHEFIRIPNCPMVRISLPS